MSLGKTTLWAASLFACTWAICSPRAFAEKAAPYLLSPEPPAMLAEPPPWPAAEAAQTNDGPAYNVVRFAAGTVEIALPREWTVKQVPMSREIRLVAGPDDVPDDPSRLERGLWLAYHRTTSVHPTAAGPARPTLEDELRSRLPKAAAGGRIVGPPQPIRIAGFFGLKQRVELAGSADAGLVRRASYIVAQTTWGVLEVMAIAPLFTEGSHSSNLGATVTSLVFHAPQPLPAISVPEIDAAEAALGSWKGQKGSLHLLPNGRARIELDAVSTLGAPQGNAASRKPGDSIDGRFTARGDLIFITWDDGGKLNYRWRLDHGDLQLIDHDRKFSRLQRLFDAPAPINRPRSAPSP